jgi:hypothetical protein
MVEKRHTTVETFDNRRGNGGLARTGPSSKTYEQGSIRLPWISLGHLPEDTWGVVKQLCPNLPTVFRSGRSHGLAAIDTLSVSVSNVFNVFL